MTRNRDLRRTKFRKCIDEEVLTSARTIITLLGKNLSKLNDPASMTYLFFQIIIRFFKNHLAVSDNFTQLREDHQRDSRAYPFNL